MLEAVTCLFSNRISFNKLNNEAKRFGLFGGLGSWWDSSARTVSWQTIVGEKTEWLPRKPQRLLPRTKKRKLPEMSKILETFLYLALGISLVATFTYDVVVITSPADSYPTTPGKFYISVGREYPPDPKKIILGSLGREWVPELSNTASERNHRRYLSGQLTGFTKALFKEALAFSSEIIAKFCNHFKSFNPFQAQLLLPAKEALFFQSRPGLRSWGHRVDRFWI